ncbi:RNA-directed DNA polymerase, eukaryota, reverse transcriptase zinc-binding domain protein [Tanacetum coccineum]|uniref:RNA-directed DNA polymerase, eukaryota, reverse transcriptase zinc-binding domain protein n=1 Tax=Tanacetum coccineum TaxID=301880 RepID=A0ABQ4XJ75_9ASTR
MWEWQSNMKHCDKGCRIIVGWNNSIVNIVVIHSLKQRLLCILESMNSQFICFLSLAIGGDFNVTLNVNEHSAWSSYFSNDMKEFKECVNQLELEDLCSSELHFTWKKNLLQVKRGDLIGILKKLDKVMVNDDFINDLLVFSHGDPIITEEDQQCLLNILPFTKGSLPVKYLGVPLITKRMGVNDCRALIDKIKSRVGSWGWKNLLDIRDTIMEVGNGLLNGIKFFYTTTNIVTPVLSNSNDKVTWVGVDGTTKKFSMKQVYSDIRDSTRKESGIALIWRDLGAIAFIMMPFMFFSIGHCGCGLNDHWVESE